MDATAYVRQRLESWGIWASLDESLPAKARLRKPAPGVIKDDDVNEATQTAVVKLREWSHRHYYLIKTLYIPDADGRTPHLDSVAKDPRHKHHIPQSTRTLRRLRTEAESKVTNILSSL